MKISEPPTSESRASGLGNTGLSDNSPVSDKLREKEEEKQNGTSNGTNYQTLLNIRVLSGLDLVRCLLQVHH